MVQSLDLNPFSQRNARTLRLGQSPDHKLIANVGMDEFSNFGLGQCLEQTVSYKSIVVRCTSSSSSTLRCSA